MRYQPLMILLSCVLMTQNIFHVAQAQQHSWRGFEMGKATIDDITSKLGPSPIETAGSQDLRYPSTQDPNLCDRLYFVNRKLELAQSASTDPRFPNRAAIEEAFGTPEAEVVFQTQEYLDYSEDGYRFICAADGTTIGVLSFRPVPRRVPRGYPNTHINLRRELPAADKPLPTALKVGTAQVSITPETLEGTQSPDANQKLHVAEDLFARAAIFQSDEQSVVLIGLDVFGLGLWDIQQLRDHLREKGFPNVIVAMSHTHANVDTIGFYGYYPKDYANQILRNAEEAVLKAAENLSSVSHLQSGTVEMSLAGGRVMDLIRNGRDPGLVDPAVSVFQAIGMDGKPVVNLVHLACHPEVIRLKDTQGLSPDFVGTLCRKVSEQLGGQTVFLNGALGGMLTPDTRFRTQEAAEEMGARLSEFAVAAARQSVPCATDGLFVETVSVEYPITAAAISTFLNNPPKPYPVRDGRVAADMSVIWIGDAQFVTVPGEVLPDIGFEIMQEMTGRLRVIVGLANGELGYLIPGFDFRANGYVERTGPGAAGGEITRAIGLRLARERP